MMMDICQRIDLVDVHLDSTGYFMKTFIIIIIIIDEFWILSKIRPF